MEGPVALRHGEEGGCAYEKLRLLAQQEGHIITAQALE